MVCVFYECARAFFRSCGVSCGSWGVLQTANHVIANLREAALKLLIRGFRIDSLSTTKQRSIFTSTEESISLGLDNACPHFSIMAMEIRSGNAAQMIEHYKCEQCFVG